MAGTVASDEKDSMWYNFTQQRLKAWQPVLDPKWVISGYLVVGALFVVLGGFLLRTSQSVEELYKDYTDISPAGQRVGDFEFLVENDMEPPIWIYYQLDGFHQNHRRYVKSRDDAQMGEAEHLRTEGPRSEEEELPLCAPWVTTGARVNYPCGLVARSVFNDSFKIRHLSPDEGAEWEMLSVNSTAKTIAWAADTNGKFQNLDPERTHHGSVQNDQALNMWIHTRFPPQVCEQTIVSAEKPWRPAYVKTKQVTVRDDGSEQQVEVTDCTGYMGSPRCNFQRRNDDGEMEDLECTGDYETQAVENWGIESGHFIVWMRIAGLPSFRKLWGMVDTPLKAGTRLNISFADNFPVLGFHGRKALVISTSSALGGRNDFLGYGYIVVGGVCVIFGLVYFYRNKVKPRNLGDVSLLVDRSGQ